MDRLLDQLEQGNLSPEQQRRLGDSRSLQTLRFIARETVRSGPLPSPEELNRYDEETRRTIVQMARDEQLHTHFMRKRALEASIWRDRLGQIFALIIGLVGLGVAYRVAGDAPVAAVTGAVGCLLGLVTVFVTSRATHSRRKADARDDAEGEGSS